MSGPLPVALAAFAPGADPRANAAEVRAALAAAGDARVLLTPECCLTGYPSAARGDLAGVDWCLVHDLEDALAAEAARRGVLLVLGTAGRHGDGFANEALACGAVAPTRYRKRCLTPTDRKHFIAGSGPVVVEWSGWRLGLAICYDVRFGDIFADLAAADADAFLLIAHMAGPDPDPGTKAQVVPRLCATRAAEWATPLAFCNSAVDDRYCDTAAWDARGIETGRLARGILRVELRRRASFDPWYAALRDEHLARLRRR